MRVDFKSEDGDQNNSITGMIEDLVDIVCTIYRPGRKSGHLKKRSLRCRDG